MDSAEKKKILIVDDEQDWISLLEHFLKNCFSKELLEIETATDPIEALKIIERKEEQFDLISTGLVMPNMDGFQFIEKLREDYPDIKIMVITNFNSADSRQRAMDLDADIFLCKPLEMKVYKEIIADHLAAKPTNAINKGKIKFFCQPKGGKDSYELIISVPDLSSTTLLDEGFNLLGAEDGNFLLIYKGKFVEVFKCYREMRDKGW